MKQRRCFKSLRFKFKNRTRSSMEVELVPIQVKQQLLQAQQYTWNNDDQRRETKAFSVVDWNYLFSVIEEDNMCLID